MTMGTLPFEVDEAKLAPPVFRPASVAKTDTIERFLASAAPFAAVVAPAGYGKTTLLARCAKADPRPFAWVAVDERDDDALVMLRSVAAAIHRVEPLASSVFEALSGTGQFHLEPGPAARQRDRRADATVWWWHSTTCTGSRTQRRSRCSPGCSTTCRPGRRWSSPAARSRGCRSRGGEPAGSCTRSGRRTSGSTAARPTSCCGARTSPSSASDVVELTAQTEGWPAGLYLAALSIRSGRAQFRRHPRLLRRQPVRR